MTTPNATSDPSNSCSSSELKETPLKKFIFLREMYKSNEFPLILPNSRTYEEERDRQEWKKAIQLGI